MSTGLTHDSRILIIGAGVFGLSTALHLAKAGYKHVSVFDYQPYDRNAYSLDAGADAASADINKVMRMSYGDEMLYQRLAFDGRAVWAAWNAQLAETPAAELPPGLAPADRLWNNCGFARLTGAAELSDEEAATLASLTKEGLRDTQFVVGDAEDERRARERGYGGKLDAFRRRERGLPLGGVFDSTGGFVLASKACSWAMHLARKMGVQFFLGDKVGRFSSFVGAGGAVKGFTTADGVEHHGDLVVVAAGGWTPSLVPQVSGLLETTAGSVAQIRIPADRPDLWERFSPDNFPVYGWGGWGHGAGLGGFPRTEDGIMKIGYRGTKYTNYEAVNGQRVSVPRTAHSKEPLTQITKQAMDAIKGLVAENLPELKEFGIASIRNCWYTDSLDNSFIVDRVPGRPGLAVCSGGSGHGFKFLPILGREVVRILEGREENGYGRLWKWRTKDGKRNGLEEGESGPRVLKNQPMATAEDWRFPETVSG